MIGIDLTGMCAVVGGGSRGLGLASAQQLAKAGAEIILMARNAERLEQALATLSRTGGQKHSYIPVDYTDPTGFAATVRDQLVDRNVHILVNNTNGPAPGTVMEKGTDDFQAAFDLLFKTYLVLTNALLPRMVKNGYGRIINVSSTSVKEPIATLVLSNTIRSAVVSWAKSLSKEIARDGITVNTILTGSFDTERQTEVTEAMAKKLGKEPAQMMREKQNAIPAGRLGKPEEYGSLVAFLASPLAGYINGTNIPIDGGTMTAL